jgi:hypothetical protein
MFLLEFMLYTAPGGGLVFFICRFIKANARVSVARVDAARAGARAEGAERAARVAEQGMLAAQGHAMEALEQTGQALEIARTIELVNENVQNLTSYLVSQIEGPEAAQESAGRHARHALPGTGAQPAITVGDPQEGILP